MSRKRNDKPGKVKPGRRLLKWLGLAGAGVAVYLGGKAGWNQVKTMEVFHCQKIVVQGNAILTQAEILKGVEIRERTSIFLYDIRALAASVEKDPYVKSCVVKRRIPGTLIVQVSERVPLAYVKLSEMYLVDEERHLLPLASGGISFDVPVITGVRMKKAAPGRRVKGEEVALAFDFIQALTAYNPKLLDKVSQIDVECGKVTVTTCRTAVEIRVGEDFSEEKLMKWEILDQYNGEKLSDLEYVDLRFKDQIIIKRRT